MKRKPGETDGELKKRIVQRNMIAGNYSRRDIKDAVLANFDTVSACKMTIDNQNYTVAVELTHAPSGSDWKLVSFTDEELQEIDSRVNRQSLGDISIPACVDARRSFGGTAPSEVVRQIKTGKKWLEGIQQREAGE